MTPAPRVLFFADAGAQVGGGHVMRCLTLAGALSRAGAICAFAATPAATVVLDTFAGVEIERAPIAAVDVASGAAAAARAAQTWRADAVVVDHYDAGPDEEAVLRAAAGRLLAMDDMRRPHACDLVVDSNLGCTAADYPNLEALTGPSFALIRPAFAGLRAESLARRAETTAVGRVLVSLGLTDVGGITARVSRRWLSVLGERALDVVVGGAASSLPALRAMAQGDPRLSLHVDTQEMAALTARADLAIGAGGSSVWERCCLGVPTLTLVLAENQAANSQALSAAGATIALDVAAADFEARLLQASDDLIRNAHHRRGLSVASAALCDGAGADRVARRLLEICPSSG